MHTRLQANDESGRLTYASEVSAARGGQCTEGTVDLRPSVNEGENRGSPATGDTYSAGGDSPELSKGWSGN